MHEAVVERTLDAPPDEVWAALTEPDRLAAWFWPWQPRIAFVPTPGAAYSFEADHPTSGPLAVDGRVLAADRPGRLAFTWRWTDEPGPTTEVDIRLGDLGGDTQIVVRHRRVDLESTADDYRRAWTDLLDRLASYVER
ncbi:MAG TPA: SRPBCC domain-containing protein [Candidatus Limnocylindrales bacterium]|nr:SRPBCC domain-containing protein [Candidatus Limnocylindrales bacterium]